MTIMWTRESVTISFLSKQQNTRTWLSYPLIQLILSIISWPNVSFLSLSLSSMIDTIIIEVISESITLVTSGGALGIRICIYLLGNLEIDTWFTNT